MELEIVGIGCRFPGRVIDAGSYWNLLRGFDSAVGPMPADRFNPDPFLGLPGEPGKSVTFRGGWLEHIDRFDHSYFHLSRREAAEMDPQQRLVLEVAHEAIHDAGLHPDDLRGARVGVFVGAGIAEYQAMSFAAIGDITPHTMSGNSLAVIANRLSYVLDLDGPSLTVDTACSAALTAFALACQAIRNGECDAAIVAGVNTMLGPSPFVGFSQAQMLSPRGVSAPFDSSADGFVRGEGCGAVLVRRADCAGSRPSRAYARIVGWGTNEDGCTASLTMPDERRQRALYQSVVERAAIRPEQVVYVEAHGTGTPVGDPIEARSISGALVGDRQRPLAIGSVKGHLGHLETAAGAAGLIKAALCVYHRELVPTANHRTVSPRIDAQALRIRVPAACEPMPTPETDGPPVVGVCSYGFGGANAFGLLAPAIPALASAPAKEPVSEPTGASIVPLSAHYRDGLTALGTAFAALDATDLREAGRWAGSVLPARRYRQAFVLSADPAAPRTEVHGEVSSRAPRILFAFGGQGSQAGDMGAALYASFPVFRDALERADAAYAVVSGRSLVRDHGLCQPRGLSEADQKNVEVIVPAIMLTQVALVGLLERAGVRPELVIGHSTGEMVAAWCRGALSLEELARLTHVRAAAQAQMQPGAMAAIARGRDEVADLIRRSNLTGVVVACVNTADSVTVSGDESAVEQLVAECQASGIRCAQLPVPKAYHSHHTDAIRSGVLSGLSGLSPRIGSTDMVSTVTGRIGPVGGDGLGPDYWAANICEPVDFLGGCRAAAGQCDLTIEISPTPVLAGYLRDNLGGDVLTTSSRQRPFDESVLLCLAELFVRGVAVEWSAVLPPTRFLPIPRVPWQHDEPLRSAVWKVPATSAPPSVVADGEIRLDRDTYGYLADHKVEGNVVLPGAALLAFTLSARRCHALTDARFERFAPLWSRGDQTVLRGGFESARWQWRTDADAVFSCTPEESHTQPADVPVPGSVAGDLVDVAKVYQALARHSGLDLNGAFQSVTEVRVHGTEAMSLVSCPSNIKSDTAVHTIILDGCFQTLAMLAGIDSHFLVPVSVDRVELARGVPMPNRVRCHARATFMGSGRMIGDLTLWTEADTFIGRVSGLTLSRMRSSRALKPSLFQTRWQPTGSTSAADSLSEILNATDRGVLRMLDASVTGQAVEAFQHSTRTIDGGVLIVTVAPVPAIAPACVVSTDAPGVLGGRTFDVVIAGADDQRAAGWLAPGGRVVCVTDALPLPQPPAESGVGIDTALRDSAPRVFFAGPPLETWPHAVAAVLGEATHAVVQRVDLVSASSLLRELLALPTPPALVFLVRDEAEGEVSPLWGFARAARNEHPSLRIWTFGLPAALPGTEVTRILSDELAAGLGGEYEKRYTDGSFEVPRLIAYDATPTGEGTEFRLDIEHPGQLSLLRWRPIRPKFEGLGANEIRIAVSHVSLHFKDVMLALGLLRGFKPILGMECAGVVTALGADVPASRPDLHIGTPVLCLSMTTDAGERRNSLFGTSAVVDQRSAIVRPAGIPVADAAGFLGVYATAWHALNDVARLQPGEWVLIHSAAGGVGQSAVRIAQRLGANVIASAGGPERREFVRRELGVQHVIDSHAPQSFADAVAEVTGGRGVDVALNSLAGDGLRATLRCLAPGGRHVEIGKRDILEDRPLGLLILKNNITFHSVHLDLLSETHPDRVRHLVETCAGHLADGSGRPIATTVFPAEQTEDAFRLLASGKHLGKVVVDLTARTGVAPGQVHPIPDSLFAADETQLVTGGLGGLGLALAGFMAERGAGRILLAGRAGTANGVAALKLAALRSAHPRVRFEPVTLDVTDASAVAALIERESTLTGVFHAATSYDAQQTTAVDADAMGVWRVKVEAALSLGALTVGRPLRHFVMVTSLAGLHGNTHQAVYVAANAALHAIARQRRAAGRPGMAIDFPILLGVGRLSEVSHVAELEFNTGKGFGAVSFADIVPALEQLLTNPDAHPPVVSIDSPNWASYLRLNRQRTLFEHLIPRSERGEKLTQATARRSAGGRTEVQQKVTEKIGFLLGANPDEIDPGQPLIELGIDSLAATELANWVGKAFGVTLSQTEFLSGITVAQLVDRVAHAEDLSPAEPVAQAGPDRGEVEAEICSKIAFVLGAKSDEINPGQPLVELGIDSLAATELANWVGKTFGVTLSQTDFLSGITLRGLVDRVLPAGAGAQPQRAAAVAAVPVRTAPAADPSRLPDHSSSRRLDVNRERNGTPHSQEKHASRGFVDVPLESPPGPIAGHREVRIPATFDVRSLDALVHELSDFQQVVVLRQESTEHFCLGMDLSAAQFGAADMSEGLLRFHQMAESLSEAAMPVVAVIDGACRGGGMLFPSLASIVLATDRASFGFPEVRRGGLPGVVGAYAQRRATAAALKPWMLTGDTFDAATAQRLGLVDTIVRSADVEKQLARILGRFQTIEPGLLSACQTTCPADTPEQALVAMGGLDPNALARNGDDTPLVRLRHSPELGVLIIELNDPAHSNAIGTALGQDLARAVATARKLDNVRAVVFQGAGQHFCVGVNPYSYIRVAKQLPVLTAARMTYDIYRAFVAVRDLGVPVVCALHGRVVGGGFAAMLNADYRIAAADAEFNYGNLPRGVCPGLLLSENLPRIAGPGRATDLYLNDYTVTADQARALGLVNEVARDAEAAQTSALEMATRLAGYATLGVRTTIALMRPPIDEARLARESLGIARCNIQGNAFAAGWKAEERRLPADFDRTIATTNADNRTLSSEVPESVGPRYEWDWQPDVWIDLDLGRPRTRRDGDAETVVLTGATGFLGAFIIDELLKRPRTTIVALVRARDAAHAAERMRRNLESYGLWRDEAATRIECVAGDVEDAGLGLPQETYDRLAHRCDAVIHNAACIDLTVSLDRLRPSNVNGVRHAARFAAAGTRSQFIHVSSVGVFSLQRFVGHGSDIRPDPLALRSGYERSKWLGEQIAFLAQREGLDVSVVRPGRIMGDSRTGASSREDWFTRYLATCVALGRIWNVEHESDMTPVDGVARMVVARLGQPCEERAWHAVSTKVLTTSQIANRLRAHGYPVQSVDFREWIDICKASAREGVRPLVETFEQMQAVALESTTIQFASDMPEADQVDPALLFDRMIGWLATQGALPKVRIAAAREANPVREATLVASGPSAGSNVGIHAMELYFPVHAVRQTDMEQYHGCPGKYTAGLGQEEITFCGDNEDAVSMAMTAVRRLMEKTGIGWDRIGRLEVGTESLVDRSKSIKTFLMDLFAEHGQHDIEGVDTYNACYGGTAALFNAVAWCQSEAADGRYALVVAVDIADLAAHQSFLNGAAAVAMLIGPDAPVVMETPRASHMMHAWDFYKPVSWPDPYPLMRDGKYSIDVYMACLEGAYHALAAKMKSTNLLASHDHAVFHCTSTYLCKRAFDQLAQLAQPGISLKDRNDLYRQKTQPSTLFTKRIGSTYTASCFVNLYSLLDHLGDAAVGRRVLMFSYGSGAAASLYRLRVDRPLPRDESVAARFGQRLFHDPETFTRIAQDYSAAYGRTDFRPPEREGEQDGVYYLAGIDEWGVRTYARRANGRREGHGSETSTLVLAK